jgi:poly-gamma-glutamate synthesis protein (capsule biosynthesis protein)
MQRPHFALGIALVVLVAGAPVAAAPPSLPRHFTIAAAGDIIPHGMLVDAGNAYLPGPGYDFTPMVGDIEPWVSAADLAICHLEGTLSATNTGISGYPRFVGPREMADAIVAAGWDACSTASNHAYDAGWNGVVSTLDVLDSAGLRHTGTARTAAERLPALYDANGVTVGHLSYTYGTNGLPVDADRPYAVNLLDADAILADAAWARDHGAEFTIVSLHWGSEYHVAPTAGQSDLAQVLLASDDIDLILGHHAHVVQPIERIDDKYIVYGMGNHLSNQNRRWGPQYFGTEDGLMVMVSVSERSDGTFGVDGIDIVPTWVQLDTYRVFSAADALLSGAAPAAAVQASFDRTVSRVMLLNPPGVYLADSPWPEVSCAGIRATIVGTAGDDTIAGTDGRDVIVGRDGRDRITGGGGADVICGGHGIDGLTGGPGRDVLLGCSGWGWLTTPYGEHALQPCDDGDVMGDTTDPTLTDAGGVICAAVARLRFCVR